MVTSDIFSLTLPAPMEETIKSLLGLINRRTMRQGAAADANVEFLKDGSPTVVEAGAIHRLIITPDVACAAGESYSLVIERSRDGGATYSAIATAIVIDDEVPAGEPFEVKGEELYSFAGFTDLEILSGDLLRVAINYTAGGTPTPASGLNVYLDIAPRK